MPAALIPILIGTTIAATAIDVVGQVKAGNAAKKQGDYNAQIAESQAADAIDRGRQDEAQFRLGVKATIGSARSNFAAQGVDVGSGSAADVQADAAFLGELDALRIRTNAQREALGYKADAENARMAGKNAQTSSRWSAASTVLGGATNVISIGQKRYGWGGKA